MIDLIDANSKIEFISKNDKTDPKTVFVLKPLSGLEMAKCASGDTETLLQLSIVEVANAKIKDKDEVIRCLPVSLLSELIEKINEINSITDKDRKN